MGQNSNTHHVGDELPSPKLDIDPRQSGTKRAVFAGGCFWCTEAVFEQLDGVIDVVSGYAGGVKQTAMYDMVSTGNTAHAESIQITYDPSKITFGQLMRVHLATHDPTTKNRQGADAGPQYRSSIFYSNDEERRVAETYIKQLDEAHVFSSSIVTMVEPLNGFYEAEAYHQDYVARNPHQPYVTQVAMPKVEKVREKFLDKLKKP